MTSSHLSADFVKARSEHSRPSELLDRQPMSGPDLRDPDRGRECSVLEIFELRWKGEKLGNTRREEKRFLDAQTLCKSCRAYLIVLRRDVSTVTCHQHLMSTSSISVDVSFLYNLKTIEDLKIYLKWLLGPFLSSGQRSSSPTLNR